MAATSNPLDLLTDSTKKRLERYAKAHGVKYEQAAANAIENWLYDAGDLETRIKEAQAAHGAVMREGGGGT